MGGPDRRVALERDLVLRLDDLRRAGERRVRVADDVRRRTRRRRRAAHVGVEILGVRERRRRRFLPVDFELPRAADRLLFALEDHRDVVALAHHPDEPREAAYGRLVDVDQRRAGHRRLHVARVQHPRNLRVDRPFQRAVHLGGDVVALRRLSDDLELLDVLDLRDAGRRVGVVARQRHVESPSANQLTVGHAPRRVGGDGDHPFADRQLADGHPQAGRRQVEQHAACFRSDATHRPAIRLNGVRSARAALIDGEVGAAHDQAGLVVGDVELVRHHLAERRSRALTEIRLADVERGGAVRTDDDPGVELAEIEIGIGAAALRRRASLCAGQGEVGVRDGADADDEVAGILEEVSTRRHAITLAARLMAA